MTNKERLVVAGAWWLAGLSLFALVNTYAHFNQKPLRLTPNDSRQSYVPPNPPPKCEDTREQYCDELGILVPRNTLPHNTTKYVILPGYTAPPTDDADYYSERADYEAQQSQQHSRYDY